MKVTAEQDNRSVIDVSDDDSEVGTRRSTRMTRQPARLTSQRMGELEDAHCLAQMNDESEVLEYGADTAVVIAFMMAEINANVSAQGYDFVIQYILQKGLKKFGQQGLDASRKEIGQLYKRTCFTPIDVSTDDY